MNCPEALEALAAGKYDWSRIALRYWSERMKAACKANKSYAISGELHSTLHTMNLKTTAKSGNELSSNILHQALVFLCIDEP